MHFLWIEVFAIFPKFSSLIAAAASLSDAHGITSADNTIFGNLVQICFVASWIDQCGLKWHLAFHYNKKKDNYSSHI